MAAPQPAPGSNGIPDVAHREFDPAESLHHHYFVEPAEMADAESLSIEQGADSFLTKWWWRRSVGRARWRSPAPLS